MMKSFPFKGFPNGGKKGNIDDFISRTINHGERSSGYCDEF